MEVRLQLGVKTGIVQHLDQWTEFIENDDLKRKKNKKTCQLQVAIFFCRDTARGRGKKKL